MHLYEEFNKLHPEQPAPKKEQDPTNLTFEDMKKYFEGMKESLMNEFKKQISELKTSEPPEGASEDNPTDNLDNKEENENGSSTDL